MPAIDPPDRDHHDECVDAEGDECICEEIEEDREPPARYDTWKERAMDREDRW